MGVHACTITHRRLNLHCEPAHQRSGAATSQGTGGTAPQCQVYLSKGAIAALDDWLALRGPRAGRLFLPINRGRRIYGKKLSASAVRDIVVKRAAQAQVAALSPHDFRRTVAGDLLDNDMDIVTVQKLLGHASVQTTASYDRPGERAKKAVGTLYMPYRRRKP